MLRTENVFEKTELKEKTVHLQNKKRQTLMLRLRKSRAGDEKGMIACIRDEYGDTYFRRDFYQLDYLKKEAASGHSMFLVAEDKDGRIAGMMVLKERFPEETMCEMASQIFRKQYRGYGLAMKFFEYGMEILRSGPYSAAYCLPVLFHDITQRLLYSLGLRATGLILNVFDMDKIKHSYKNGRNHKHSQGIQTMKLHKQEAGILYLPMEHRTFAASVYDRLGVSYRINTEEKNTAIPAGGSIRYQYDPAESSMEICIISIGTDTLERIRLLHSFYPLKGMQTYNIFLNINDSHAIAAYYFLSKMGYFMTGFKCLCSEREYMVLHHPGEVEVYMEDYVLSSEFALIASYVKGCYKKLYETEGTGQS